MRKWFLLALLAGLVALTAGPAWAGGPSNGLERAMAVQEAHTDGLMGIPGVVGTAVGLGADGSPAVFVFAERAGIPRIPRTLDGIPVAVHVTGKIVALADPLGKAVGATKIDPKKWFPRPVPIGISTGNAGSCSAGTIGARVTDGTNVYALSNNHVYALENKASLGSKVLQPGLYDTSCVYDSKNDLGNLSAFQEIVFSTSASNTIDAAIALSSTANLGKATPSNGYGTPKSAIVSASVDQKVQKYGRTTSLTKGSVVAINATVNVSYSSGTARFVDQIVILGTKPFSKAGDSGSLVVTDPGRNPVGLLFAGSATGYTFANPIGAVLGALGVTVDGE